MNPVFLKWHTWLINDAPQKALKWETRNLEIIHVPLRLAVIKCRRQMLFISTHTVFLFIKVSLEPEELHFVSTIALRNKSKFWKMEFGVRWLRVIPSKWASYSYYFYSNKEYSEIFLFEKYFSVGKFIWFPNCLSLPFVFNLFIRR